MKILNLCNDYLMKNKYKFVIYIVISIISSILGLISPYISGLFIDNLVSNRSVYLLYKYIFIILSISIVKIVINYFANIIYIKLQTISAFSLNVDIIEHIKKIPLKQFNKMDSIYINHRINNDSNSIITFYIKTITGITINLITIFYASYFLFKINYYIFALLLILVLIYIFFYNIFKNSLYNKSYKQKEAQNVFFTKMNEQLKYIKFIKTHSVNEIFKQKLIDYFEILLRNSIIYAKISYIYSSNNGFIKLIAQLTIYILGGLQVIKGNLTIGYLTILINYFNIILESSTYFFDLSKEYQDNVVYYNRLQELLSLEKENNGHVILKKINTIEVKNLNFSYNDDSIIKGVNLCFKKGNIYSILGDNGTGKSTLIDILIGLHINDYTGKILYNGIDIKEINMTYARRNLMGITEQNPCYFKDTILNNLQLNQTKPKEEIDNLTELLNLKKFILKQNNNIKTIIEEPEKSLSGGEKQKISLIRTFLKNGDLIILDEPTSALDNDSIKKFETYINNIKKEKIIIIISHNKKINNISDFSIELK